jgi:uroporphyrinogen-III synthase
MILLTRPEPAASRSARRFAALGHEVVVSPLMEAVPLTPDGLPAPGPGKALALTSARAVEAITGTPALARDWRDLAHLPVYAVGESTADAARLAGARDVHVAQGTLESLVDLIARMPPEGELIYPAGRERSGDLSGLLAPHGVRVNMVEVYAMIAQASLDERTRAALSAAGAFIAPCYSRRSAQALARALADWPDHPPATFLVLSAQVGEPLAGLGRCLVAERPDEDALVALLPKTC